VFQDGNDKTDGDRKTRPLWTCLPIASAGVRPWGRGTPHCQLRPKLSSRAVSCRCWRFCLSASAPRRAGRRNTLAGRLLPGLRREPAIDLRAVDRNPLASVGTLVLGLRCSWCPGSAPMPNFLGLYAASARRRNDGGKVGISMPGDDDIERRPITVQSLSDVELIKLLQFHDDEELAELIEAELARRKKDGGNQ
jgi:hypothetical protein